jgi:hypothetical protein
MRRKDVTTQYFIQPVHHEEAQSTQTKLNFEFVIIKYFVIISAISGGLFRSVREI